MDPLARIERTLEQALAGVTGKSCPTRLGAAFHHAVFPRGARIRPRLCLSVAAACGEDAPDLVEAAAAAIELLHCASLVHDDLPCFDDADTRRGQLSVQKAFGEPAAVLAGDGLIVLAFQILAQAAARRPDRLAPLFAVITASIGAPAGIIAGQAWELEAQIDLRRYQRAKTGALFAAATMAGAVACGRPAEPWRMLGLRLGEAFQVADDLLDVAGSAEQLGKPVHQDAAFGRPNAVASLGLAGALDRLTHLSELAVRSVPDCPGRDDLCSHIRSETQRLTPTDIAQAAA